MDSDPRDRSREERIARYWGETSRRGMRVVTEAEERQREHAGPQGERLTPWVRDDPARPQDELPDRRYDPADRPPDDHRGDATLGIPPRRPSGALAFVGVAAGGLLLIGILLWILVRMLPGSDLGSEGAFPREESPVPAAPAAVGTVGEPVRVGPLALKVHGVRFIAPSAQEQPEPGMRWFALDVEVVNESTDEQDISMLEMFDLQDDGGRQYRPTIIGTVPEYAEGKLAPGLRLRGEVVFEIDGEAEPVLFLIASPDRSAQAQVRLIED